MKHAPTIYQRLVLSYVLLLALLAAVGVRSSIMLHRASALDSQTALSPTQAAEARSGMTAAEDGLVIAGLTAGALIAAGFLFSIIFPIRRMTAAARRAARGEDRIHWPAHDDLGAVAEEFNRMAAEMHSLRETESGRRLIDHQLCDAVVESIFEPVIVTDAGGQVLKLNRAAKSILGAGAEDRMALIHTPGGEKILNAVREAVSMQRATAHEREFALLPMKIGQAERSYRLRTTPMRDREGSLMGAVSVLEDITEMQDLDRFKTRFLTVASRKLRQPLEQLRLGLYTLTRGFAGEMRPLQTDLLQGAEQEAERLNDLMSDLIEVSEIDTGGREIRIERMPPLDILRDARGRHREPARKKKIEIDIQAFGDLSPVSGDRRALRSITDNLLENAIRYTPEGGTVTLRAEEHRGKVQFFVLDTGRGIEAERLPRIFGRFNTGHDGGTGLGLALVRRLVELLGGQVSVESRLGHGATFTFTLPVAAQAATRHPIEVG